MSQPPSFTLPSISDNSGGWGPATAILPEQFRDIPYAPYSKADKLGRIADWSAPEQKDDRRDQGGRQGRQKYPRGDQYQAFGSGLANMFAYSHNEDESSFSVVDRSAAQKKMSGFRVSAGQRGGRGQQRGGAGGRGGYRGFGGNTGGYNRGGGGRGGRQQVSGRRRFGWKDYDKPLRSRDASVQVGPDWKMLDEIDFNRLSKLSFAVEEPVDLDMYGFLLPYDRGYDQIRTRIEKPLQHKDRVKYESTTSDDPIIQQLRQEEAGVVFATDSILALLMCAGRTVYPWDIVIRREGDQLIFDKRDGGVFDYITVNENTADPPAEAADKDNINSQSALSVEATFVNQNFAFQVVQDDPSLRLEFEHPNPFASHEDAETLASCAFRYRRFDLSSKSTSNEVEEDTEEIGLIVRTELDAYTRTPQGDDTYLTLRALNQFDVVAQGSGGALDWKKALDTQPGAVVATEMKNNSAKLARWAVQSYLAGVEQLRLGFITRINPKDNHRHVILGTQAYKPRDFAASMNISISNGWGIVKAVVDMCLRLKEGKYVLVKDPNRPTVRIYSVPSGTFEEPEPDEIGTVAREE